MDTEVDAIVNLAKYKSLEALVADKVMSLGPGSKLCERSFYVANMFDIYQKLVNWQLLMPRIRPYYAVKCNDLPEIVKFLAALGTSFDCASKREIQQVLSLGVEPAQIIYANPCKTNSFIKYSRSVKVDLMTFDNELELRKMAQLFPEAKLVLRIKGNEENSVTKLNIKFGADLDKSYKLLKLAKQLDLHVVGVSFHNGSGCQDPMSYMRSIEQCRLAFDMARELGHEPHLLDIGGGFPGESGTCKLFEEMCSIINIALDKYFPTDCGVDVIAEPGRYFVASALTLCCMVTSKRVEIDQATGEPSQINYYLNDGVYGGFMAVIYEDAKPEPQLIVNKHARNNQTKLPSALWGPTCDSLDLVRSQVDIQELQVGEWIAFANMGAYTLSCATSFNGFEKAYVVIADNIGHQQGSYLRLSLDSARASDAANKLSAISCDLSELERQAARRWASGEPMLASDLNGNTVLSRQDSLDDLLPPPQQTGENNQQQQQKQLHTRREYLFLQESAGLNSEERVTDFQVTAGQ